AAGRERVVVGRGAGDDAVEIVREPLRLHQRLAPAGRAADEVGALRASALLRRDQRLAGLGGLLQRARGEVADLLRMAQRPGGAAAAGLVAVVGAGRGVAPLGSRADLR